MQSNFDRAALTSISEPAAVKAKATLNEFFSFVISIDWSLVPEKVAPLACVSKKNRY